MQELAAAAKPNHPLRVLRQQMGLLQATLARKSGVSLRTISYIEAGAAPRMQTRRKLLKALGIPLERHFDIFGGW
jgi:transcriptional regulator with XRE-family HTH domain